MSETCSDVRGNWPYGNIRCNKPAKFTVEGKVYCGIHNPERGIARRAANLAKYELGVAERKRERDIAAARDAVVDAAKDWQVRDEGGGWDRVHALSQAVDALRALEAQP